jgi:hypothetical protein
MLEIDTIDPTSQCMRKLNSRFNYPEKLEKCLKEYDKKIEEAINELQN